MVDYELRQEFLRTCEKKFAAGAKEHRAAGSAVEFQGDPIAEYEAEQIDSHNYLDVIYGRGSISTTEWMEAQRKHYEMWCWARSLRSR